MTYQVYLVEDEPNLNRLLTSYLQKEGWKVSSFHTGREAREAMCIKPHIWVLDIMLPDMDGYELIAEIKEISPQVPVIFISARDSDLDRIIGLEKGSDDYLPKPFLPRELIIRIGKILERVYGGAFRSEKQEEACKLPPYIVERGKRKVSKDNFKIDLTSKEYDLLLLLLENQGNALSREQLLQHLWSSLYYGSDRVVDDLVRRLRKKMPEIEIETIYGYGYRLV
jgi:two-component system, OmpR family, response regulator CssR